MVVIRLFAATATLVALLSYAANSALAAEGEKASAFLSDTHRAIAAIRQNEQQSPDEKRALIERVLDKSLDLATMSRVALGKREAAFSRSELSEFIQEYSRFLQYVYLREIAWSDPDDLPTLKGVEVDPKTGWVTIGTTAKQRSSLGTRRGQFRKSSVFRAEYVLRERHGSWRIAAIRFDGVDLNRVFGAQFEALLQKSTPAEVLAEIHEQNSRQAATNPLQ
jgi:ABC-type transporter MlaC component